MRKRLIKALAGAIVGFIVFYIVSIIGKLTPISGSLSVFIVLFFEYFLAGFTATLISRVWYVSVLTLLVFYIHFFIIYLTATYMIEGLGVFMGILFPIVPVLIGSFIAESMLRLPHKSIFKML